MLERVMHIIIKTLAYIFILLLFVLLFVRMSGFGRAIFEGKAKDKPQEARETVLVVEEKESLLDISKDLAEQGIVDNAYLFAISLRCMNGYENIRPGEYRVSSSTKPSDILKQLTHEEEKLQ